MFIVFSVIITIISVIIVFTALAFMVDNGFHCDVKDYYRIISSILFLLIVNLWTYNAFLPGFEFPTHAQKFKILDTNGSQVIDLGSSYNSEDRFLNLNKMFGKKFEEDTITLEQTPGFWRWGMHYPRSTWRLPQE